MRESFGRKTPLVILPIDEFTGTVIRDPALEVFVEGAGKPLIKQEGFRVFLNGAAKIAERDIVVTLRGSAYQEMRVSIAADRIEQKHPVVEIGMKPGRNYPFPPGTLYIEGSLPEHAALWVAKEEGAGALRLYADARMGDDRLRIYQDKSQDLSRHSYLLLEQGGKNREWVTCTEAADFSQGIYQLSDYLIHDYTRERAKLYNAVSCERDILGEDCFLAFPGEPGQEMTICCHVSDDHTIRVKGGESLWLDFSQM